MMTEYTEDDRYDRSFRVIFAIHHLEASCLASAAGIPVDIVHMMNCGIPVPAAVAEIVLEAMSRLTERVYTLENVEVVLREDLAALQSDIASFLRSQLPLSDNE